MLSDQSRKLMDQVINWQNEIGTIAGPFLPTDTKQSWLARASRKCSCSLRHIQSLYYGHVSDPKFSVATKIISAADQARIQEAQRDAARLVGIYQNAANALGNIDADRHRVNIDALISAARILGALD